MIQVWGRPTSICTERVLWGMAEADVPYALTLASGTMGSQGHVSKGGPPFGIVNTPEYRKLNPNGTVPTINDNSFILWESNAILMYLALKYAPEAMYQSKPEVLAQASQWMAWTNEYLEPHLHTLVMELLRLPPAQRNAAAAEDAFTEIKKPLALLDAHLSQREFVAGEHFSVGDIPAGCAVDRWTLLANNRPKFPHVEAWLERLAARPGFEKHVEPPDFHLAG